MVRNRTKSPLSCWINTFPHRNKSYIWHNTLFTHCFSDKRAMTTKKQQKKQLQPQPQQQQQQQQQEQNHDTSTPPLPTGSPPPSPGTSSFVEDRPWSESVSASVIDTAINDRFIHEAGPPTAISILRTQPAFIGKLYKMLEDSTQDLICWSSNGDYFSVYNSSLFAKQVLPQYFKHNNWQSFVRQLNMYGFSKINEMIHSNLNYDNQAWDFKHPHFKRGDFQSLILVKRKSVRPSSGLSGASSYQPSMVTGISSSMDGGSSDAPGQSSSFTQTTYDHPGNGDMDVDNRVRRLDERVRHVSTNVNNLTSEIQDIKSLIYRQQNTIHELVTLVRNYTDSAPSTESSSVPPSAVEDSPHRNNSLPSIHNLAGDLQGSSSRHSSNENSHHYNHHHNHRHPPPHPLYHHSSLLRQLPREPSHSPPLADQGLPRRSSHPSSSKGKSKQNSNAIYPLLNSMSDTMDDDI